MNQQTCSLVQQDPTGGNGTPYLPLLRQQWTLASTMSGVTLYEYIVLWYEVSQEIPDVVALQGFIYIYMFSMYNMYIKHIYYTASNFTPKNGNSTCLYWEPSGSTSYLSPPFNLLKTPKPGISHLLQMKHSLSLQIPKSPWWPSPSFISTHTAVRCSENKQTNPHQNQSLSVNHLQ